MGTTESETDTDQHEEHDDQQTGPAQPNAGATTDRLPDDHPVVKALKKANEEAAATRIRLKELEDRDKSEGEKLTDKLTAAEQRAAEAEAKSLRLEVAAEKGLTAAQARRLVGTTKEELEADADELLETFKPQEPAKGTRPTEKLRSGVTPEGPPDTRPDIRKIVESIPRNP